MCVCLSVCVCPTWDIRNGRLYCHVAYTILNNFTWWVAQTAFQAYMTSGLREKAFRRFSPVTHWIPCTHGYFSGYPGGMNLAHYNKAFGTLSKGIRWRTHPPHHKSNCTNCFSIPYNVRFERKSLWKFFASYTLHGYFSGYLGQDECGPLHVQESF